MTGTIRPKPLLWVGSSRKDLRRFPIDVRSEIGFALFQAQLGSKHESAKPLKGFGGAGTLEVVTAEDGNAYRTVYTVRFARAVYVLHVFQKKSTRGIATSTRDVDAIRRRMQEAAADYEVRYGKEDRKS